MRVVSKDNSLKHYKWGNQCDGWNLVDENSLSVKQEKMPAGTSETKHYHQYAQQFFYILKGAASFETAHSTIDVQAGEGLHIPAGTQHKIINNTVADVDFIVCSQPATNNDRINCE